MSYSRNGGGYDNRNQGGIPSPWATAAPAGGNNVSNLLGSLMNNAGSGNMANLATSLVAQALQNKPGGMLIGGNHFGGQGSAPMGGQFNNSGPRGGGGYMDRSGGRDDYRRGRDNRAPSSNSSRSRPPFRRSRSRSRDRGMTARGSRPRGADSSSDKNRPPSQKRARAGSPKDRAPFEIYIGNYPVRFRENDVRKLFQENGVTVTTIRLKHDGHKVFAFAETSSEAEIQTAVKALDSKEIHGRRLRVRSSKDKDNKQAQATQEKKRPAPKRELKEEDVTRHLVFAFNGFLDRQGKKEPVDEEKAKKLEQARDLLKEAFEIPDDDSLKISRNLELIFLHNNRREIPIPPAPEEPKEVKTEDDVEAKKEDVEKADQETKDEEAVEGKTDVQEEAEDESKLVEELGDAVEDLVEEKETNQEAIEEAIEETIEENDEEIEEVTEEAGEEEAEVEEDQEEQEEEAEGEAEPSSPTGSSSRGRGGGRARRARGRRGGGAS